MFPLSFSKNNNNNKKKLRNTIVHRHHLVRIVFKTIHVRDPTNAKLPFFFLSFVGYVYSQIPLMDTGVCLESHPDLCCTVQSQSYNLYIFGIDLCFPSCQLTISSP